MELPRRVISISLCLGAILWAGAARGQYFAPPQAPQDKGDPFLDDPIPPQLDWTQPRDPFASPLPPPGSEELPPPLAPQVQRQAPITDGVLTGYEWDEGIELGPTRPVEGEATPVWNSGTWIRRGRWYLIQELSLLHRDIFRDVDLMTDTTIGSRRFLGVPRRDPEVSAGYRLTFGSILFRDCENRDHSLEFGFAVLGNWTVEGDTQSVSPNALVSEIDRTFQGGFNGTDVAFYSYEERAYSYELNYRVSERLGEDLLELQPNGQWIRTRKTKHIQSYLIGVRVLSLDDFFEYQALSTVPDFRRGSLNIRTSNDMLGFQLGGDIFWQHKRFDYGLRTKVGPYVNFASQNSQLVVLEGETMNRNSRVEQDRLAFVGEFAVFGRYYLCPNITLSAGYQAMWINTLALAPNQVQIDPEAPPRIVANKAEWFQGVLLGVEMFW